MGVKKLASYGGTCKVCNTPYNTGEEVCMQKIGESWVICKNEDCFKQQGGSIDAPKQGGKFTSSKLPLSMATEVYNMAEGLLDSFKAKRGKTGVDGFGKESKTPMEMSIEIEAQFVESMFKTLSGNFKV